MADDGERKLLPPLGVVGRRILLGISVVLFAGVGGGLLYLEFWVEPESVAYWMLWVAIGAFAVQKGLDEYRAFSERDELGLQAFELPALVYPALRAVHAVRSASGLDRRPAYGKLEKVITSAAFNVDGEDGKARACLFLYRKGDQELTCVDQVGRESDRPTSPVRSGTQRASYTLDLLLHGKEQYYPDLKKDWPPCSSKSYFEEREYNSFMTVPVWSPDQKRVWGMLTLDTPRRKTYTKSDLSTLRLLGLLLGLALIDQTGEDSDGLTATADNPVIWSSREAQIHMAIKRNRQSTMTKKAARRRHLAAAGRRNIVEAWVPGRATKGTKKSSDVVDLLVSDPAAYRREMVKEARRRARSPQDSGRGLLSAV